ncbi:hypothetical protein K9M48_04070 [Candidatus Gracilibacteria bacterium]|nr:hypothetical protein [Candidatus Gracilibacteria bacterium]
MWKFLKIFGIFIVLYHILVTIIVYGIFGGNYAELPTLLRDGTWIIFFLTIFFVYNKHRKEYFEKRKYPRIALIIMLVFGISISLFKGKSLFDIFVGIKYGFFYMIIFLTASFIGFVNREKIKKIKNIDIIGKTLIGIVLTGFIWQGAKLIRPDFFMHIGYGPLNDFFFGQNPPIYYLTGYQGTLRRQGLFAGPNNYGYFLVAFLPVILLFFKNLNKKIKYGFIGLWVVAILLTLSRTAILGGAFVFILLNINWIRKNKIKTGIAILIGIALILALSFLKGSSTLNHIIAKFSSINYVVNNPGGLGLGTAGPAIHHNGTILPENYFIQIMLDIGTIGFILWAGVWFFILAIHKRIKYFWGKSENLKYNIIYQLWKYMDIGRLCLIFMGLFLHVFEDSMVNYLFFGFYGIISGYLTKHKV